jgi:hypothetical protein
MLALPLKDGSHLHACSHDDLALYVIVYIWDA